MPLAPRQERFAKRFFPRLIDAMLALGPGEFEPEDPKAYLKGAGLGGLCLHLTYVLADGYRVTINISLRLKPGEAPYIVRDAKDMKAADLSSWDRIHYAMHYERGKPAVFGFDLEQPWGYHAHIRPDTTKHTPPAKVPINIIDFDPFRFVSMVAAFRKDGAYPAEAME